MFKTVAPEKFAIRCQTKFFSHLLLKRFVDSFLITWREIIEWTWWAIVKEDHEKTFILSLDVFNTGFGNMTSTNTTVYKPIEVSLQLILILYFICIMITYTEPWVIFFHNVILMKARKDTFLNIATDPLPTPPPKREWKTAKIGTVDRWFKNIFGHWRFKICTMPSLED